MSRGSGSHQRKLILCILAPFLCQLLYGGALNLEILTVPSQVQWQPFPAGGGDSYVAALIIIQITPHRHLVSKSNWLPRPLQPESCQLFTHSAFNHNLMDGILCIKMWPRHTGKRGQGGRADSHAQGIEIKA